MSYQEKYLKYKTKYLQLKGGSSSSAASEDGGGGGASIGPREIIIENFENFDKNPTPQTISECIKELIVNSFEIYNNLLKKSNRCT